VALAVTEQPYCPGQLPDVPVEAQLPGLADGREQRLALRGKPGQCLVRALQPPSQLDMSRLTCPHPKMISVTYE
jgi:hypothetical protein